jgi:nitric oxide reductase NorE protein
MLGRLISKRGPMEANDIRKDISDQEDHPGSEGVSTFVFIDMIVFTLIFIVFLSEKWRLPSLFLADAKHLDFRFGLANTLILLTSSLFMAQGVKAARAGVVSQVRLQLQLCLLCAALFCASKLAEYSAKLASGLTPAKDSFFSLYYFITGAHLMHVLAGSIFILHCHATARAGGLDKVYVRKLESTGLFWHFVDLVWLFIFPLFYLVGAV